MTEKYKQNLERISQYGDVYIRNQYNYPNNWINKEAVEVESYGGGTVLIPARSITTEFNTMGKVKGFYQCDEPTYDKIEQLLPLVEWQNQYAKDKLFHVNLFPSYVDKEALSNHSLSEYIQHYIDTILTEVEGPKTLGLDHYPLRNKNGTNYVSDTYLSDLFTVSNAARKYNSRSDKTSEITVGFCVQTFASSEFRDIGSKEDISFQTNTCLAMGAKYLEYFSYLSSDDMSGMLQNGEKRQAYYYVKEVNNELQKWGHVLMSYDWRGAMPVSGSEERENTLAFLKVYTQKLSSFQLVEKVESSRDALVGEFKDADGDYGYMTVNYTEPSGGKSTEVTYTFSADIKEAVVYQNGNSMVYPVANGQIQIYLEAGDAAFVIPQ